MSNDILSTLSPLKNKSLDLTLNGICFHVDVKGMNTLKKAVSQYLSADSTPAGSLYDPVKLADENGGRLYEIEKHSGERIQIFGQYLDECQIPGRYVDPLTPEEVSGRLSLFCGQIPQCLTDESLEKILLAVPRKKDKTLYKNRIVPVLKLRFVDYDAMFLIMYARNVNDKTLEINFRRSYIGEALSRKPDLSGTAGITSSPGEDPAMRINAMLESREGDAPSSKKVAADPGYQAYKAQMKEILKKSFEAYMDECHTYQKLAEAVSASSDILFDGKSFALSNGFTWKKEISREIESLGGMISFEADKYTSYYVADLQHYDAMESSMARRLYKELGKPVIITDYQLWKALFSVHPAH